MTLEEIQNGHIFLIDKPLDWTSFDVVRKIKYSIQNQFKVKKIKVGHAGTLDPKATGLLVVCTGKATKNIQEIQDATKVYTGVIKLGVQTPSYDTETEEINPKSLENIKESDILALEYYFNGEFSQLPPIFSALKIEGKRAYNLARKGEEVEVKPRMINFFEFKITKIELPYISFYVHCSKGTYIRSLAFDAGEKLNCGAYLTALKREKLGALSVEKANNSILENTFWES